MIKLSQTKVLILAAIISGLAALFTLIGLTTPKWLSRGVGLWNCNEVCSVPAATLTILALLLIVISCILLILILAQLFSRALRFLPLLLMTVATVLLLAAMASYLRYLGVSGYSFELMITAHTFSFLVAILLAFWFGRDLEDKPMAMPKKTPIPITMTNLPRTRVL